MEDGPAGSPQDLRMSISEAFLLEPRSLGALASLVGRSFLLPLLLGEIGRDYPLRLPLVICNNRPRLFRAFSKQSLYEFLLLRESNT